MHTDIYIYIYIMYYIYMYTVIYCILNMLCIYIEYILSFVHPSFVGSLRPVRAVPVGGAPCMGTHFEACLEWCYKGFIRIQT